MRAGRLLRGGIVALLVAVATSLSACSIGAPTSGHAGSTSLGSAAHLTIPDCLSPLPTPAPTPTQSPASSTGELVNFAPVYAVVCRYSGLQQTGSPVRQGTLVGSAVIRSSARLVSLRRELDSFVLLPPGTAIACPADLGSRFDIYLGSASETMHLQLGGSGCGFLVGPRGDYWHEGTGDLSDELLALTSK